MERGYSPLENAIRAMDVSVCEAFSKSGALAPVTFAPGDRTLEPNHEVAEAFPNSIAASKNIILTAAETMTSKVTGKRIAVLFSGGPAAGGHNVVVGLKQILGPDNTLMGVIAGPKGLLRGNLFEITDEHVNEIRNTGGFDFLGTDRTKIEKPDDIEKVRNVCREQNLDAIVIIGGDDSNTNAALLAEKLFSDVKDDGSGVQVIGVPKTIDGDLQLGDDLPISFGFDTATKIYAEKVGNLLRDTASSLKYWHFVRLMGRSASHVTLEVALQTHPTITLISEEIRERDIPLSEIVDIIAQTIIERAKKDLNYGVILVPEGLIEFIPGFTTMIDDLNDKMAQFKDELNGKSIREQLLFMYSKLTQSHGELLESLPDSIKYMLMADRDEHGNLPVSRIETEAMLSNAVKARISELDANVKFESLNHFFGYEARCGASSLFDSSYTYNLGATAGSLILDGRTGYMASLTVLDKGARPLGIPIASLLDIEMRKGKPAKVIEKALVKLDSQAFLYLQSRRKLWAEYDFSSSPGPVQFWGPTARQMPKTVALNRGYSSLDFKF
ncbi:MAG: diphosphate--fructose-6-phosphate 1-phosphotransferase [Deltaproteobacteria bacterium]|nr:diphosphate--fructose-6-phosphate 1-phosphotransferase [Deltaproteobacteria bacterium]